MNKEIGQLSALALLELLAPSRYCPRWMPRWMILITVMRQLVKTVAPVRAGLKLYLIEQIYLRRLEALY